MNLNHLNLCVADVTATREFFVAYFGLHCQHDHDGLSILTDDGGFVLTVMKAQPEHTTTYPGSFDVGFYVDEPDVHALHERMATAGLDVGEIQTTERRGTVFYVASPIGVLVEVCCPA